MSRWVKCECGNDVLQPDCYHSIIPWRAKDHCSKCGVTDLSGNFFDVIKTQQHINSRAKAEADAEYNYYYSKRMKELNNEQ